MAAGISRGRRGLEAAYSMAGSGGRHLWTIKTGIFALGGVSERVSERKISSLHLFVCHASSCARVSKTRATPIHVADLGGVPMKTYF